MIITYLLLQGALFLFAIGALFQVRQFLQLNPSISTDTNLYNFKRLARVNMYMALVYICAAVPVIGLSIYLGFAYGLYGLAVVLGTSVPQMLISMYLKSSEDKSRNLPAANQFADEHRRVSQVWMKKALPDF